jgi:fumarate hydratase class II
MNGLMGHLPATLAESIEAAAEQVVEGRHDKEFPIDIFQTGSGTSTNMNANELIGHLAGAHPNDHVNRGQSSNDVIPTAMHIAVAESLVVRLLPAMRQLGASLQRKTAEFHDIIKIGRTHLQDAVPIRMGQEFSGYARQVEAACERVDAALAGIYELPLGGTAVGTGLNAPPGFAQGAIVEIADRTGLPFVEARNHFEAQAARDAACFLSGALRTYAVALTKIANDIRWLGSGPRCGLGELKLPAVQPGSSIMPGKVNPVIPEAAAMVAAEVIGNDAAITIGGQSGNFQLNVMLPLIAYNLLESIRLLANVLPALADRALAGFTVNEGRLQEALERNPILVTALNSIIGYEKGAAIAKKAYAEGKPIREMAQKMTDLKPDQLAQLLDPLELTRGGIKGGTSGGG